MPTVKKSPLIVCSVLGVLWICVILKMTSHYTAFTWLWRVPEGVHLDTLNISALHLKGVKWNVMELQEPLAKIFSRASCLPLPSFPTPSPVSLKDCSSPHVLMFDGGRLGNNMCQFVSLYILRHLFGIRVSITKKMHTTLSKLFPNITLPVNDPACFTSNTTVITYNALYRLLYNNSRNIAQRNSGLVNSSLVITKSYRVSGYPCPRDLILVHRDILRPLLVYRENVLSKAKSVIATSLSSLHRHPPHSSSTLVTVHIRRKDYIEYLKTCYQLKPLDETYFHRAFDFFRQRVTHPAFVIVSDDPQWSKRLTAPDVVVADGNAAEVDLAILSQGSHTITSYGTFSFMGATLAHGHIAHPISANPNYNVFQCVNLSYIHFIPRD